MITSSEVSLWESPEFVLSMNICTVCFCILIDGFHGTLPDWGRIAYLANEWRWWALSGHPPPVRYLDSCVLTAVFLGLQRRWNSRSKPFLPFPTLSLLPQCLDLITLLHDTFGLFVRRLQKTDISRSLFGPLAAHEIIVHFSSILTTRLLSLEWTKAWLPLRISSLSPNCSCSRFFASPWILKMAVAWDTLTNWAIVPLCARFSNR